MQFRSGTDSQTGETCKPIVDDWEPSDTSGSSEIWPLIVISFIRILVSQAGLLQGQVWLTATTQPPSLVSPVLHWVHRSG
ncbi:unnamed protein product [Phytophthora fragariaefolia]|uniref:Unnamed protein product n=1 Tax=Phytophthora fragariaefolia TaxID=1490495 RepID=A0A9W6XP52_9STRA|nr:unnamed protein product [Phytophthora fragariaefolia]